MVILQVWCWASGGLAHPEPHCQRDGAWKVLTTFHPRLSASGMIRVYIACAADLLVHSSCLLKQDWAFGPLLGLIWRSASISWEGSDNVHWDFAGHFLVIPEL